MAYEIKRFPYDGTVDADGHILEPADLWENYLEEKYRPRALRIQVDDVGYEYLEIDQTPSKRSRKGSLGLLGAMGEEDMRPRPDRRYSDNMPFGSCDPGETAAPHIISHVGEDCFMWASDYPHPDHPHTWVDDLTRYAEQLPASAREKVLGANVKRIYRLD